MVFYPALNGEIKEDTIRVKVIDSFVNPGYFLANQPQNDWAIALLEKEVGSTPYIELAQGYQLPDTALIAGYPEDLNYAKKEKEMYEAKGTIMVPQQEKITYKIDTMAGQSGAPILVELEPDRWFAIGVHNKAGDKSSNFNAGCYFSERILKYIIENIGLLLGIPKIVEFTGKPKPKPKP